MQNELSIDIETFSSIDLKKSGLYKYVESPDFEILMLAYALGDEPVSLVDLAAGETLPQDLIDMILDDSIEKTAHNAMFERVCINEYFRKIIGIKVNTKWRCTMVRCAQVGLPMSLDQVGRVLKLSTTKDKEGHALIRYFTMPCKPTKTNEGRTRNYPHHEPAKWEKFKMYCRQDVVVERNVKRKTAFYKETEQEVHLYHLDQKINDVGVLVSPTFIKNCISIDASDKIRLRDEAVDLTDLSNPNSRNQILTWLAENGVESEDLKAETVKNLLASDTINGTVREVLQIRQEMAKTSVRKYQAMLNAYMADCRIRGLLQFYGAGRTGRWAGRMVQVHNLPRIHLKHWMLDNARNIMMANAVDDMYLYYGNIPYMLSQLIRTAFIAPPGHRFIIADFSAIEARVLAWLAGEQWRLDVFATHGKIYEASASQMFSVPLESIDKGSPLRQKGKVAELALGYQGGKNALITMGALNEGLTEEELPDIVKAWRAASPNIVQYWKDVQRAAIEAVKGSKTHVGNVKFYLKDKVLMVELPSGRCLSYMHPQIKQEMVTFFKFNFEYKHFKKGDTTLMNYELAKGLAAKLITTEEGTLPIGDCVKTPFLNEMLFYEGMNQEKKIWCRIPTYGGKLTENIVQAVARDCLAHSMIQLDKAGYKIVMHVHDEVVLECAAGEGSVMEVDEIMSEGAAWAEGLPLKADSYISEYYRKD